MPCLAKGLAILASLALAMLVGSSIVMAAGWRPEVATETDAEWLTRLDARLAPVHGSLRDTLALVGSGTDVEADAYVVILQAQAAKGIAILDAMEPAPRCGVDYMAVERTMLLAFGDSADAWAQYRAGSSQAIADVNGLVSAAVYLLTAYGDVVRAGACATPIPEPTVEPAAATAIPMRAPEGG